MPTPRHSIAYQPTFEHCEDDEADTEQEIIETLIGISEKVHFPAKVGALKAACA